MSPVLSIISITVSVLLSSSAFNSLIASPSVAIESKNEQFSKFQCLKFDGIDDVVNSGDIEAINGSQYLTIEMWVRIDTFGAWRTFFCKYQDLGNRIQLQQYKEPGKLAVCVNNNADIKNGGNQAYFYTPRAEVTIGDWFHLAMVFDGTKPLYQRLKLYINGLDRPLKRDGSLNWVIPTHIPSTNAPLLLGAQKPDGSFGYKGLMDEVRIWTVALTETEICKNMENSLKGNENGLRVYYPMTIATGTSDQLNDLTSDRHLARLVNIDFRNALIYRKVAAPIAAASKPQILEISANSAMISWTRGSGSANAVFLTGKVSASPYPLSGITYNADPVFENGSCIGKSEWYCVYNGHAVETEITGLLAGTQYHLVIIDYNGSPGNEQYLIDSSDMCKLSFTTASEPTKDSQVIVFDLPDLMVTGVSPYLLNATASSDLMVLYSSSDTTVARIEGDSLLIIGPGKTCITASQAGNGSFAPAADVTCILEVRDDER